MKNKFKIFLITFCLCILVVPIVALAQNLNSTNYRVEDSIFDGGTGSSSSTNYTSRESLGGIESGAASSTNYKNISGFQPGAYPGIPGTPTLTNTGSSLYNSLDFVIATGPGQQVDTTYAIAISSDNFTTTFFIQTDDTIASSAAWQTYPGWNSGTGERVTGLLASTAYKIKVKARYGADSESGYSSTATATTSAPSLIVAISGLSSGTTIAGVTTTVTSLSGAMGFSTLTIGDGSPNIAAQRVTVSTNATGGYTTTSQQDGNLRTLSGNDIDPVTGTNASPAAFDTGVVTGWFGYHTTDSSLCTGTASRFTSNNTYASLSLTPYEIACSAGPVTNEATDIVYKLVIGTQQEAGDYQNTLTYITTATF